MDLFDKKFVHFMWGDGLKGKTGFVSNDIECLHHYVNNEPYATELIKHSDDEAQPFETTEGIRFRFAYYDPNYEVKRAFNEGKKIQFLSRQQQSNGEWRDVWYDCVGPNEPKFLEKVEYRVKPEEKKYRPYINSAEMIADFKDRFKVNCPAYCEPMIWVKNKDNDACFLIFAFCGTFIKFNDDAPFMLKELFDGYIYLDGSPAGMEVKE